MTELFGVTIEIAGTSKEVILEELKEIVEHFETHIDRLPNWGNGSANNNVASEFDTFHSSTEDDFVENFKYSFVRDFITTLTKN